MPTFDIKIPGGATVAVEGQPFRANVKNARFEFFVHQAHDNLLQWCVSHRSGVLITTVSQQRLRLNRGDPFEAGKEALNEFVATTNQDALVQALAQLEDTLKRSRA
jgi:nicotinamide mononucleotide adenylyltransferase